VHTLDGAGSNEHAFVVAPLTAHPTAVCFEVTEAFTNDGGGSALEP